MAIKPLIAVFVMIIIGLSLIGVISTQQAAVSQKTKAVDEVGKKSGII